MDFSDFGKRSKLSEDDYYLSEEGFIIFTETYHLKRGYCCKSNCKHCPYGYQQSTGEIKK
jgi:biotin synthase-like enzyme